MFELLYVDLGFVSIHSFIVHIISENLQQQILRHYLLATMNMNVHPVMFLLNYSRRLGNNKVLLQFVSLSILVPSPFENSFSKFSFVTCVLSAGPSLRL